MRRALGTLLAVVIVLVVIAVELLASGSGERARPAPPLPHRVLQPPRTTLESLRGEPALINFWASWCGPCRQEMPLLDSIYRKYKDMGFELIGVNVEPDSKAANAWLKATPVTYPILYDPQSQVSQLYQVQAMPTTVIIDRTGTVRYLHRGYVAGDENAYLNSIRSLIVQ